MTEKETRKLTCVVTGKALVDTKQYYERKVKKVGNEEELHRTYVCREAKNLLIKGYDVDKIREMIKIRFSEF